MFSNLFKKFWLVVTQEEGTDAVVPAREVFVVRDYNAWKAFDAVKAFCRHQKDKTGNPWQVVSMTRL